jgi:hypothetical protein
MNSPAVTWKVRRIKRTPWLAVQTWSWIHRVRRNTQLDGLAEPSPSATFNEPLVISDAYHWLAALRLDRAAYTTSREAD